MAGLFQIREFKFEKDYELVCRWWQHRGWPKVPTELLSSTGIMVEDGCFVYAAGWVYTTNSKTGLLEHLISNPYTPMKKRHAAIQFLISSGTKVLNDMGYPVVLAWLESTGLMKCYERCGYVKGDDSLTTMVSVKEGYRL